MATSASRAALRLTRNWALELWLCESSLHKSENNPESEFTGERVIPGLVNEDLWAEHVSRYAFAERYSHGARVLDIGSGSGYGTADLAQHASSAVGIDLSGEAVDYARREYPLGNLSFLPASALALPFADLRPACPHSTSSAGVPKRPGSGAN